MAAPSLKIAVVNKFTFKWGGGQPGLGEFYRAWDQEYVPLFVGFAPKGNSYETTLVQPEFLTVDFGGLQKPTLAAIKQAWTDAAVKAFAKRPADMRDFVLDVTEESYGYVVSLFMDVNPDQCDIIIGGHEYIVRPQSSPTWSTTLEKVRLILNRWSEVFPVVIGKDGNGKFMARQAFASDFEPGFEHAASFSVVGPDHVPIYLFGNSDQHYHMQWSGQMEFFKMKVKRTVADVLAAQVPIPFDEIKANYRVALCARCFGSSKPWSAAIKIDDGLGVTIVRNQDGSITGGRDGLMVTANSFERDSNMFMELVLTGQYDLLKHVSVADSYMRAAGPADSSEINLLIYWPFVKAGVEHWVYPGVLSNSPFRDDVRMNLSLATSGDESLVRSLYNLGTGSSAVSTGPLKYTLNVAYLPDNEFYHAPRVPASLLQAPRPPSLVAIAAAAKTWIPTLSQMRYDNGVVVPPLVEVPSTGSTTSPPITPVPSADLTAISAVLSALGAKMDNVSTDLSGLGKTVEALAQNVSSIHVALSGSTGENADASSALNRALYVINSNTAVQADTILARLADVDGKLLGRTQRLAEQAAVSFLTSIVSR